MDVMQKNSITIIHRDGGRIHSYLQPVPYHLRFPSPIIGQTKQRSVELLVNSKSINTFRLDLYLNNTHFTHLVSCSEFAAGRIDLIDISISKIIYISYKAIQVIHVFILKCGEKIKM